MSNLEIQRGIIRTNCIDSLDRTNIGQTLIGYYAALCQLKRLGITKTVEIQLESDFYVKFYQLFEQMGDSISMQYGGSKAHHANVGTKKGVYQVLTELGTSIHRHWANTFTDYRKQNIYNLFLGIYQPLKNKTALWNINDDRELLLSMEQAPSELKGLPPKWWERHLKGFEAGLAPKLVKDLQPIFRKKEIEAETTGDSSPETKQTVALECNQSK